MGKSRKGEKVLIQICGINGFGKIPQTKVNSESIIMMFGMSYATTQIQGV